MIIPCTNLHCGDFQTANVRFDDTKEGIRIQKKLTLLELGLHSKWSPAGKVHVIMAPSPPWMGNQTFIPMGSCWMSENRGIHPFTTEFTKICMLNHAVQTVTPACFCPLFPDKSRGAPISAQAHPNKPGVSETGPPDKKGVPSTLWCLL